MDGHKTHSGCCGCSLGAIDRRAFLAFGGAVAGIAAAGCATTGAAGARAGAAGGERVRPALAKKTLVVQPALCYHIPQRRDQTSWRGWGGLHTEDDIVQEIARIEGELKSLAQQAEFPLEFKPVARVANVEQATAVRNGAADVMLIYGATGGVGEMEALISPDRYNLVFVRHKSGPVYLWYEIVHPRLLRKTVDEYGQPGLCTADVVVDEYADMLWRMRSLYALKNTLGTPMVCIGGASGWGAGGAQAPEIATNLWKMQLVDVPYEDVGKRIAAIKADESALQAATKAARDYLATPGTVCKVDEVHMVRAYLLKQLFEDLMADAGAQAMTINHCMGAIMPISETTACMALSLINDDGLLAFCESDFAVIPSGVLLHNICQTPVFLQDPTYPHHGVITLAHCTAPRKMDGRTCEPTEIVTHFESDYGAAPKVNMRVGQQVTVIDPDFGDKRWIGFRGKIQDNPYLDICRSQVDVTIEGDCAKLAEEMRGFHWMLSYGDQLKEMGYALNKLGINWYNLSDDRIREA